MSKPVEITLRLAQAVLAMLPPPPPRLLAGEATFGVDVEPRKNLVDRLPIRVGHLQV